MVQNEQQRIRSRLRRYERALAKEKKELGTYRDGVGKRYEIAPHYRLLDDNEGAIAAFQWFEREFDDDSGRPDHLSLLESCAPPRGRRCRGSEEAAPGDAQ